MRWLRRGLLLFILLLATAAGGLYWGLQQIEHRLHKQGFTWENRVQSPSEIAWVNLSSPGLSASRLALTLDPWPQLHLQDVQVDPTALNQPQIAGSTTGPAVPEGLPAIPVTVTATGVSVWVGERQLVGPLSGVLHPDVILSGDSGHLHHLNGSWQLGFFTHIDWEGIETTAAVTITETTPLTVDIVFEAPAITHALLANSTLTLPRTTVNLQWDRHTQETTGVCQVGDVTAAFAGTLAPEDQTFNLQVDSKANLNDVVALFGDQIPEARGGQAHGTLSLSATLSGFPLVWSAQIGAEDLAAEGIINNLDDLKYGHFTWRAPTTAGEWMIRTTGDGHPNWTDRLEGRIVAAAMVAAEDATFFQHRGYDLEGMQIALDELSSGEARARGGSTITQQLAKNLFLSGERTIVRKLRELLYTLEMETALGKNRILTLYTNVVEMGPEIYGIRRGSEAYFLKQPAQLTIRESAFLAAILPSPRSSYAAAHQRDRRPVSAINAIIDNMVNTGHISRDQANFSMRRTLRFVPPEDGRAH